MSDRDIVLELEEPLTHAMGLGQAVRLLGYGLRAQDSEEAAAILALCECLEHDHQKILCIWKRLLTSTTSPQQRRSRRR
ncbi:MAG: hypothetical protein RB191_08970 [Terriglobia bacterium]|nr:hypothetical protein [Terriglobia bacterium]